MPLNSVEELRYVKHHLKKRYGMYKERVICAEYVQIQSSKKKAKNRLLVVGKHRLYTFRKSRLQSDMATDNHWYDLVEFNYESATRLILRFRKSKQVLSQLDICYHNMPIIIQAICSSYGAVTLGYNDELCCQFEFYSRTDLLPLLQFSKEIIAGGIIESYESQCCYFGVYVSKDISRLLEAQFRKGSFDLDLTDCPLVEDPKIMLPLIGALRHNTYFLSLKLTKCQGNQQVILMLANVVRFNSTLTKIELSKLDSPGSFEVFGNSLKRNTEHAIQVIDISKSKIPSRAMESIAEALASFSHALQALSFSNCQLSPKSLHFLFNCFKQNYGMSLSIQQLDLSHNRLGGRGSVLLGNWLNRIRLDSHLEHLYIRNTSLAFVFIGRALVHYPNLRSLDLSENKLDAASVQLLTLWIETSMALQSLNVSSCEISGEYAGKLLSVLLTNANLRELRVHLDHNDLKREQDGIYIVEALRRGSNIHTLTLSQNKFKAAALIGIIDALQQHRSLHTLVLDQCYKSGSSPETNNMVASALAILVNQNNNIRALSLSGTYKHVISPFLEHVSPSAALEELDISCNSIKDMGASILTCLLRNHENLAYLVVDDNNISYTGWQAILQIFSTNKRLERIPFPWVDYQRLGIKQGTTEEQKLRKVLTDIQKMCSMNFKAHNDEHVFPDLKRYALFMKSTIRVDFEAPTAVSPLATVPEDIQDEDDPFSFNNDESDDETERELFALKMQSSTAGSTIASNIKRSLVESSEEEDFLQADFESSEEDLPPLPAREPLKTPPLPVRDSPMPLIDSEPNLTLECGANNLNNPSIPPAHSTLPPLPGALPKPPTCMNPPVQAPPSALPPLPGVLPSPSTTLPPLPGAPNPEEEEQNPGTKSQTNECSSKKKTKKRKGSKIRVIKSESAQASPKDSKRKKSRETASPRPKRSKRKQSIPTIENSEGSAKPAPVEHSSSLLDSELQKSKDKLKKTNQSRKMTMAQSVPSVKDYVFSDEEDSSEEDLRPQSEIFSKQYTGDSIGDLLSRVMGERREFIKEDEDDDCEDYSSDDDSW